MNKKIKKHVVFKQKIAIELISKGKRMDRATNLSSALGSDIALPPQTRTRTPLDVAKELHRHYRDNNSTYIKCNWRHQDGPLRGRLCLRATNWFCSGCHYKKRGSCFYEPMRVCPTCFPEHLRHEERKLIESLSSNVLQNQ